MNESILTRIVGVSEGYEVTQTAMEDDHLRLHLKVKADQFRCPDCGSAEVSRKGHRERELQTIPIGLTPVSLRTEVPDCQCRGCGRRFELFPPFAPAY